MHSKDRFDNRLVQLHVRRLIVSSLVAMTCAVGFVVPSAAAGAPLYPDLRMLAPTDLKLGMTLVNGESRYVVRFGTTTLNAGEGPVELHGTPHVPADGLFDAYQWVYDDPAGVTQYPVGTFVYHQSHGHFHFDNFARYEVWARDRFDEALSKNFKSGSPLYASTKVSFCLFDSWRWSPTARSVAFYRTCTPLMEGLSAGWADIYGVLLDDQWVDVGRRPLPDGAYVVRQIVDPANLMYESDGKSDPSREGHVANHAYTYFSIVNGKLVT